MPTLLVGDRIAVNWVIYGLDPLAGTPWTRLVGQKRLLPRLPKRGQVVIFGVPRNDRTIFVKRIVGMPGESIELRHGVIHIDGQPIIRRRLEPQIEELSGRAIERFEEKLPNGVTYDVIETEAEGPFDNESPRKIPADHYFLLGDNRDNSWDSRMRSIGPVPFSNIIGKVMLVVTSRVADGPRELIWYSPATWRHGVRWQRMFMRL